MKNKNTKTSKTTVKNTSTILTLDLGIKTGWAIRDNTTTISSGTNCFKPSRRESNKMIYLRFKRWLTDLKKAVGGFDAIHFQEVRKHVRTDAVYGYGGFMAHLIVFAIHHNIPYRCVPVQAIKRNITGRGYSSREEVIYAIKSKGFNPADYNESNALALLNLVLINEILGIRI